MNLKLEFCKWQEISVNCCLAFCSQTASIWVISQYWFAEDTKELYKILKNTCWAIVITIRSFVLPHPPCCRHHVLALIYKPLLLEIPGYHIVLQFVDFVDHPYLQLQLWQLPNNRIINNHLPKWRWKVVDICWTTKWQGKYPPLSLTVRWISVLVYTTQIPKN